MDIFQAIASGQIRKKDAINSINKKNKHYSYKFVEITGAPKHPNENYIKAMRNCSFLVQIFKENPGYRLSINRTAISKCGKGWEEGITWDEIQSIKNAVGFQDKCAIELYPPKNDVVNGANIRHIFIVNEPPDYMWKNNARNC